MTINNNHEESERRGGGEEHAAMEKLLHLSYVKPIKFCMKLRYSAEELN